jgi:hypothetical protein
MEFDKVRAGHGVELSSVSPLSRKSKTQPLGEELG